MIVSRSPLCFGTLYFAIETIDKRLRNDALTAFSRDARPFHFCWPIAAGLPQPRVGASAVADGQKLAFDRGKGNCLTCHVIKGGDLPGTIGPELKGHQVKIP